MESEIGIPLFCLEKTVALSVTDRKQAEKFALSGVVDAEQMERRENKVKKRQTILRGRSFWHPPHSTFSRSPSGS